jgi:hypothetical protein
MRILKLNLLAVALLLFGTTSAHAFAINMVARNATTSLDVSDTVTVDVFFDATATGIILFSVAVLNSSASLLSYDAAASAALPVIYVNPFDPYPSYSTGAQPFTLLQSVTSMVGMVTLPTVELLPQQTPAWLTWPAPPPGQEQVNINYAELNITDTFDTRATGLNLWIGSMVFHVDAPITTETLALSMTVGSAILQLGEIVQDPNTIALSAPITLTGVVPEPTTAVLIGFGLLGLAISGRRQS